MTNAFGARKTLATREGGALYWSLTELEKAGLGDVTTLPYSIKVILESLLRNVDGRTVREEDVAMAAGADPSRPPEREVGFRPARVLLQDFTGVPAVVDLAAMREAVRRLGGDPARINPLIPADLVIDHSVQVDRFGSTTSLEENVAIEFERNRERYEFLKWGQSAFKNFRVVPPSTGIIHQVNLEYLASVVDRRSAGGETVLLTDTLVGTDSHTTMINGLGVLGWGVGGIEAEAAMLGQPIYMLLPQVVGVRLTGVLRSGVTATDLVLTLTELLRKHGVVEKIVEYTGPGVAALSLTDRAVVANMAPEYGATAGFFPVDEVTLGYLGLTGRGEDLVDRVERYTKAQTLFREKDAPAPRYSAVIELDMSSVVPCVAGPRRPQDRLPLETVKRSFFDAMKTLYKKETRGRAPVTTADRVTVRSDTFVADRKPVTVGDTETSLTHGAVVIASITSCTNTSSPELMLGAGLLAKKAVERGLAVRPWVKTSLAPGSRVVTRYLERAGLLPFLEALRFHVVGYGCATCIGNSGPLPEAVARAVEERDLVVAGVLSGNRNFEGRINPHVKANYLASPALVVAYALAGTMDIDLTREPLAVDPNGAPVYLDDLWPTPKEVRSAARKVTGKMFADEYSDVFRGGARWQAVPAAGGELYSWDEGSTYIRNPPFFTELTREAAPPEPIQGARVLALLGDSVTTDHISPAGSIKEGGPAARYLEARGVTPDEYNSFGSRRGNHEVMMRGTFANVRLKNLLVPGTEGGVTEHLPTGERMSIYDAAMRYAGEKTPLLILAGRDYGMGSSRDWAAKGTRLLGVRAVIAESYERIHRSNLVGMGVLPLEFLPGDSAAKLGLTGREVYEISRMDDLQPGGTVDVRVGEDFQFSARVRLDTAVEMEYYRNGGILQTVIRGILTAAR